MLGGRSQPLAAAVKGNRPVVGVIGSSEYQPPYRLVGNLVAFPQGGDSALIIVESDDHLASEGVRLPRRSGRGSLLTTKSPAETRGNEDFNEGMPLLATSRRSLHGIEIGWI